MSELCFLAADFGAGSGRTIAGLFKKDKISIKQTHRFSNPQIKLLGHYYWNLLYLYSELKNGIAHTIKQGYKNIQSIGVDTWGVDFGLIGRDDKILGNPYCYRDARTDGMMERAFQLMPKDEIYNHTGIQFMQLNSIFQLISMVEENHPFLDIAETLLFMPDLFNYLLTGQKVSEFSIASTSGLLNGVSKQWEHNIFKSLKLPFHIMPSIIQPGTIIGNLLPELQNELGTDSIDIVAPACHDTGSAVAAVPAKLNDWAYLSSGTWSLLGVEVENPIINAQSLKNNFTNEGGVNGTTRFLRNTMGLWLLERCLFNWKQAGNSHTYDELFALAEKSKSFKSIINPDDNRFLNPTNMPEAISQFCVEKKQKSPETAGEFVRSILESLALKYRYIIELINSMRDKPIKILHIVGGGSQNEMLNQFTANATGLEVVAGPIEATALGNIMMQAIAKKELSSIEQGREIIARSFKLKHYKPVNEAQWNEAYNKHFEIFSAE